MHLFIWIEKLNLHDKFFKKYDSDFFSSSHEFVLVRVVDSCSQNETKLTYYLDIALSQYDLDQYRIHNLSSYTKKWSSIYSKIHLHSLPNLCRKIFFWNNNWITHLVFIKNWWQCEFYDYSSVQPACFWCNVFVMIYFHTWLVL